MTVSVQVVCHPSPFMYCSRCIVVFHTCTATWTTVLVDLLNLADLIWGRIATNNSTTLHTVQDLTRALSCSLCMMAMQVGMSVGSFGSLVVERDVFS